MSESRAPAPTAARRRAPFLLTAALVFTIDLAAVVWLTWPLATHLATHLPDAHGACRFDLLATGSFLATEARNLSAGGTPLGGGFYHPTPQPLAYAHLALGALPVFAPVFWATGNPTLALNALFLVAVAATAASLHLVAWRWTGSHLAGAVAAVAFLTDRWVLWELVPTAPFYGLLLWLPPIVALAARPRPGWRWSAALAALIFLQGLTDVVYLPPAVVAPLLALAALRAVRADGRRDARRIAIATLLGVAALAPLYAPYALLRSAEPELASQTVWGANPAPQALDRALWGHQAPAAIAPAAAALAAAGLAVHLARRRRVTPREAWLACTVFAVVGAAISLPRALAIGGATIALPWYDWLPPLALLRAPERLGVAALIGIALAAGLGLAECADALAALFRRRAATALRAGLALLVCALSYRQYQTGFGRPAFERRPLPAAYPLQAAIASDAPLTRALAAGSGPLLELPLGPLDVLPPFHARAMYRAILHGRPILNGYSSYFPAGFRERMALAARLPDAAAVTALARTAGLAQVVVQSAEIAEPAARRAWLDLAAHGGRADLTLAARDGDTLVFTVAAPPAAPGSPAEPAMPPRAP